MTDRVVWRKWHTGTEHAHEVWVPGVFYADSVCGVFADQHPNKVPTGENRCKRCERIVEKMEASDDE